MRFYRYFMVFFASIYLSVLLSACANMPTTKSNQTTKTIKLTNIFNEEEFKSKIAPSGKNIIKGSAYATGIFTGTVGDMQFVESATCTEVALAPVTPYSAERIEKIYGNTTEAYQPLSNNDIKFEPENPSYLANIRKAQCNADGAFSFDRVADGEYFITATIVKIVRDDLWRGGVAVTRVAVSKGQTIQVFISNQLTKNLKALKYGNPPLKYEMIFKKAITASLKDPSSGKFRNIQKPKKFWLAKDQNYDEGNELPVETAAPFWIICGEVNAKNSFGGYTGYEIEAILYSPNGAIASAPLGETKSVLYPYLASEDEPCGR